MGDALLLSETAARPETGPDTAPDIVNLSTDPVTRARA